MSSNFSTYFFLCLQADENRALIIRQDFNLKGPYTCLLCDDLPIIGQTSYDFHRHLCECHFRERLLAAIETKEPPVQPPPPPAVPPGGDPSITPPPPPPPVKKYGCPVPNCGYELPQKWVMAKHYGLKHQIARQMYLQICNLEGMPPEELQAQLQHSARYEAALAAAQAAKAAEALANGPKVRRF